MNINVERELIKQDLDKVTDIHLLEAIRKLLDSAKFNSGKRIPLTEDELYNRILESRKAISEGKLIAQEEAKEYFRKKNEGNRD
jgi:hypothetical protein